MLIINCRVGQKVILETADGDEVTITVNEVTRSNVKLAFDAPENVEIVRVEDEG